MTKTTPKNFNLEKTYKKSDIDILVDLKKEKIKTWDLSNKKVFALYELLFEHINKIYEIQFEFTEQIEDEKGNSTFLFHSHCIFNTGLNNPKQVTVFIDQTGFASIHCYHTTCNDYFKYSETLSTINKHVYVYWEDFTSFIFLSKVEKIEYIFEI